MDSKNNIKVSRRYAKSLIELMLNEDINKEQVSENLNNIKTILNNSDDLYYAMLNPVISAMDKENVIDAVFEKDCTPEIRNFLKILVEKNRFSYVYSIIDEFKKLLNKLNDIVQIDVTSAIELEQERKEEIQKKLNEKLNKEIEIKYTIDDSIIAGLVYKIEDDIFDTSFKRKIEDLKKELI